ncbi:hypothetical protein IQ266_22645 [filamentous cyanobacterium LEGE 11480]|uniref:Uncharacterized protein n=1 Tax=Romeriopsis navalis LEGE 11480 TaxID=2777977 RepID=A0A928VU27_9CYAN|nr:hypothetical protein [Romeriopsis navalis]MBE9032542.1 hypothetical protein [Romeriopsis navalis LEGE 11480]
MINLLLLAAILIPFFAIQHLVIRFIARRNGFKPVTHDLSGLGPVLFRQRWGSVRIGKTTSWGRSVTITAFQDYLHLRLNPLMGGGELLLPLQSAEYEFSRWMRGELVDIAIDGKTYLFGKKIVQIVKQHYV